MKRLFLILAVLIITTNAHAQKSYGVDFEKINWAKLCPAVESVPMQFKYNSCPVVHPATDRFISSGMGPKYDKELTDCKVRARIYNELTHEHTRFGGWRHCATRFQSQFDTMMTFQKKYSDDEVVKFRDKYLSEGVYDAGYVRDLRSRVRADQQRTKQFTNK
jgi:hypothetical protein